jgi:Flp pilus assembly protein CpaB
MRNTSLWIALGSGLLGAAALELYMRDFESRMTGGPKAEVVLTNRDLQPGDVIKREHLATRAVPAAYLESRHIHVKDVDRLVGLRVAEHVSATESLLWSDLVDFAADERTLAKLVREGKRAMTISMTRGAFAALLRPGDRVDVLHVLHNIGLDPNTGRAPKVRTVLSSVLVLAVDDNLGSPYGEPTRTRGTKVTLSVDTNDAHALAAAQANGDLQLLLRNPDDAGDARSAASGLAEALTRTEGDEP